MGGSFSTSSAASKAKPAVTRKAPGGTITPIDRAVLDLKNARDRLNKYRKKLTAEEEKLVERAKQAKQEKRTSTALGLLRLRKHKLREVENAENQLLTIHQMIETVDSKQNEAQVLQAMKTGKDALTKLHEETSVEDVLELMDQIQEQNEVETEISGILSGVPSLSIDDEAAVEAELEALAAELNMEDNTDIADLPAVPQTKLPELQTPVEPKEPARKPAQAKVAVAS